jgi:hypothetical protein
MPRTTTLSVADGQRLELSCQFSVSVVSTEIDKRTLGFLNFLVR